MNENITVVIPLYNKQESIVKAITSILNQTYHNYKIIIINDGSTDNSFELARSIVDDRISVISQKNSGESAARNKGIELAETEWIALLDADDEYKPEFLSEMVKLMVEYPNADLIGAGYDIIKIDGIRQEATTMYASYKGYIENYYEMLCSGFPFNSSSVVLKKSKLIEIGGFPIGVRNGGDISTWIKMFEVAKIYYTNKSLSIYHLDSENKVSYYNWEIEYFPIAQLRRLRELKKIKKEYRLAVNELISKYNVKTAKALFLAGRPIDGIKILISTLYTKKYLTISVNLLFIYFPRSIVRRFKNNFK